MKNKFEIGDKILVLAKVTSDMISYTSYFPDYPSSEYLKLKVEVIGVDINNYCMFLTPKEQNKDCIVDSNTMVRFGCDSKFLNKNVWWMKQEYLEPYIKCKKCKL